MSTPDFSTALRQIKEANSEFLSLITQLREFLTTDKDLQFVLGDETILVKGIIALIEAYKNGSFEQVTIGSGSQTVVLTIDSDGNLRVEDAAGNLLKVVCSELSASEITNSTIGSVTAQDCNIKSATGTMNVYGGNVTLNNITVQDTFNVTSAVAKNVTATNITPGSSYITDLYIQGGRKMAFSDERKIFFNDGAPVDSFASLMSAGFSDEVWNWEESTAKPSMLGINFDVYTTSSLPGLISFNGNNWYSDFNRALNIPNYISNVKVQASVGISPSAKVAFTDDPILAAFFAWPSIYPDTYHMELVAREFHPEDIGKEVYYRTSGSPWSIYRTLTIFYESDRHTPLSASLGTLYEIPPYSCVRFIVNRTGSNTEGMSVSILEIA